MIKESALLKHMTPMWVAGNIILSTTSLSVLAVGYFLGRQADASWQLWAIRALLLFAPLGVLSSLYTHSILMYRAAAVVHMMVWVWLSLRFVTAGFQAFDLIRDLLFVVPMFLSIASLQGLLLSFGMTHPVVTAEDIKAAILNEET